MAIADVLRIAQLRGVDVAVFLQAARYIGEADVRVFDALHAVTCGPERRILSSDKAFDRLGLRRIPLEQ
jgi:predicted nucleic acid-binding protein